MYVCLCKSVREAEFQDIVTRHSGSSEAIRPAMGLIDPAAAKCEAQIDNLINDVIRMRMQ